VLTTLLSPSAGSLGRMTAADDGPDMSDDLRPATEAEEAAWHAGHASIPNALETDDGLLVPVDFKLSMRQGSLRHTAVDLREIERWCDTQGLVMKDFPDSMITRAAETGSTAELEAWIETNEPRTQGMWDEEPAPYSNYDTSPIGSYYD